MSTNAFVLLNSAEAGHDLTRMLRLNMTEILKHKRAQVEIENVVATADLNQHLDLEAIFQATPGTRYNPERFPGLVYKLKKPATTTLLFASGKMVCTGARSTRSAKAAIAQIISNLMNCGIVILARPEVEIENIVASGNLDGSIDLENVAERLFNTMYEPEQFPAIIYRMTEPKAVFLIFTSGRVVCTAAKTETEVHLAVERLRNTLEMNGLITCERASNNEEKQLLAAIPP